MRAGGSLKRTALACGALHRGRTNRWRMAAAVSGLLMAGSLSGCAASVAPTPIIIYVTPAPASVTAAPQTPAPTPAPTLRKPAKPTPSPRPTAKPKPTASPAPLLDVQGNGMKTTQSFSAPGDWVVAYAYDCSNFGQAGVFSVFLYSEDGTLVAGIANQEGISGNDSSYVHQSGTFYLVIDSECAWHIVAE